MEDSVAMVTFWKLFVDGATSTVLMQFKWKLIKYRVYTLFSAQCTPEDLTIRRRSLTSYISHTQIPSAGSHAFSIAITPGLHHNAKGLESNPLVRPNSGGQRTMCSGKWCQDLYSILLLKVVVFDHVTRRQMSGSLSNKSFNRTIWMILWIAYHMHCIMLIRLDIYSVTPCRTCEHIFYHVWKRGTIEWLLKCTCQAQVKGIARY